MFKARWAIGAAAFGCAVMSATVMAAEATPDQLSAMVTDGQYTQAILGCNALLERSGDDAASVDRARVFAIKGEAHLQVHAYSAAAEAFDHAAAAEASDDHVAGFDRAMAELIRHSRQGTYAPKVAADSADTTPSAPIDILSRANRPAAFAALFAEESKADESKLKSASSASSLTVVLRAVGTAQLLDDLEIAATSKDVQTKAETQTLSAHGQDLVSTTLQKMDSQISRVAKSARQNQRRSGMAMNGPGGFGGPAGGGMGGGGPFRSAGYASASISPTDSAQTARAALSPSAVSELNDIISTAKKLGVAATDFSKMATDDAKWTSLTSDAQRTASRAQDVLDGNFDTPPDGASADTRDGN